MEKKAKNIQRVGVCIIVIVFMCQSTVYGYTDRDLRGLLGGSAISVEEQVVPYSLEEIQKIEREYYRIEHENRVAKEINKNNVQMMDKMKEVSELKKKQKNGVLQRNKEMGEGAKVSYFFERYTANTVQWEEIQQKEQRISTIKVEEIENIWTTKFLEVQRYKKQKEQAVSPEIELGDLGDSLQSPLKSGFLITSHFGYRTHPVTGAQLSFHSGLDIAARRGESVGAVWRGEVFRTYTSHTGGNTVEIKHGNGILTRYLHLDSISVKVGQRVKQYEEIGRAGSTGIWSTGPHLHLELEVEGMKMNPIYLYGKEGLRHFKVYASNNGMLSEVGEIEKKINKGVDILQHSTSPEKPVLKYIEQARDRGFTDIGQGSVKVKNLYATMPKGLYPELEVMWDVE